MNKEIFLETMVKQTIETTSPCNGVERKDEKSR